MFFFFFFIPFTSLYFNTLLTHPPFLQVILSPLSIKTQIEFHQQCTYSFQCLLFKPSTDYWNKCLWIQHPKIWCSQYPGLSVPYSKDTFLYLNSDAHGHSFILVITSYCNLSISQTANIPFSVLKPLTFYLTIFIHQFLQYTCIISCMKQVASPGSMHDTGCLGLVHWDNPEGWYGKGGGFRMRNTCIPVVDSFWYLAKLIQFVKFKNKIKLKKKRKVMSPSPIPHTTFLLEN